MKKIIILTGIIIFSAIKAFCSDIVPDYVSIEYNNTLGLYQAPNEIVLYKEPDESSAIVYSISWIGEKVFPDSVKANNLFIVQIPSKNLGFLAVYDETDDWAEVIYDNSSGAKGWIKKDDPYKFMSWVAFYNMYGRKYGLKMLKEIPADAKNIHVSPDEKSKIISTVNMPQKINLTAIRGNWALVSIFDIDRTPKTGYIRWRSDEGVKYYFPAIK